MAKTKTKRQVGYLLSKYSPLTYAQRANLEAELHSGEVRVKRNKPGTRTRSKPKGGW